MFTPNFLLLNKRGFNQTFIFLVLHGAIHSESKERFLFGIILFSSTPKTAPKPPHSLHAPNGLLKLNRFIEGSINLTPSNSNLLENFFCFPEQLTYISPSPSKKASLHTSIILNLKFSSFLKTSPRSIKTLKFKCFCFEVNKDSIV